MQGKRSSRVKVAPQARATTTQRIVETAPTGHVRTALDRAKVVLGSSQARMASSREALEASEASLGAFERDRRVVVSSRATTRASVIAFARRLRADGIPCERVIVRLKDELRQAAAAKLGTLATNELMDLAVRWAIDAFYENAAKSGNRGRHLSKSGASDASRIRAS